MFYRRVVGKLMMQYIRNINERNKQPNWTPFLEDALDTLNQLFGVCKSKKQRDALCFLMNKVFRPGVDPQRRPDARTSKV